MDRDYGFQLYVRVILCLHNPVGLDGFDFSSAPVLSNGVSMKNLLVSLGSQ